MTRSQRGDSVYYQNTGSTAVQVSVYASQASANPAFTETLQPGFVSAAELGIGHTYGNTAGIQVNAGPVRVLSQVCTFGGTPAYWLCKGSETAPFGGQNQARGR